ncbi:carbohydrate esterase family 3 protein [Amniculicola lignicola CBS 123094]|uniref:Carbohydrate esterase family 3 protein n=1 Tax=Amniculicola lignicola CBS 123094 TaxID=1392246 RepID=A0A6A5VZE8_9PLEO|nr:carbohydrate esterase family 3 protein [Amniculicola lignicola CBS 123094]
MNHLTVAQNVTTTASNVKIMAFGASIVGAPGCWRAMLWKKLQDSDIKNTDFVGSNKAPDCGFPYDGENEGHAGALAIEYASKGNLTGWLAAAKPDVIVMHVGTNDVVQNKPTADIITAYGTLVDQMRNSKPTIKIIVSRNPIPFRYTESRVPALNDAIAAWAPTKSTSQSRIWIVDNFTGFNATSDTVDGEHPNNAGDAKIANKFYQPLADAIKSVS